jgi:hypothetical protein
MLALKSTKYHCLDDLDFGIGNQPQCPTDIHYSATPHHQYRAVILCVGWNRTQADARAKHPFFPVSSSPTPPSSPSPASPTPLPSRRALPLPASLRPSEHAALPCLAVWRTSLPTACEISHAPSLPPSSDKLRGSAPHGLILLVRVPHLLASLCRRGRRPSRPPFASARAAPPGLAPSAHVPPLPSDESGCGAPGQWYSMAGRRIWA